MNETGCRNIRQNIYFCLFDRDIGSKIRQVNFTSILCHGSTDVSVTEHQAICIVLFHPNALKSMLPFFEVAALDKNQDATGLKNAYRHN